MQDRHGKITIFDYDPEETIRFMATLLKNPGSVSKFWPPEQLLPKSGLKYAYKNGADFVCLGMYDFQIVEDVNIALDALAKAQERPRPWMA